MKIFRKKRGQVTIETMIELFLATLIVIGLMTYVGNATSDTTFHKMFLARDVALLLDSVYAAPGDVDYIYYLGENTFRFDIGESKVVVSELDGTRSKSYTYAEDSLMTNPTWSTETPIKAIEISKRGDVVSVSGISYDPNQNAREVFSSFTKFVSDMQEEDEYCMDSFYFNEEKFGKGYYIIIYEDGPAVLFRNKGEETAISNIKIDAIASTESGLNIDSVFSSYNVYTDDVVIAPYGGLPSGMRVEKELNSEEIFVVAKDGKQVLSVPSPELRLLEQCK
ncbi:MAG: hypothetical protein GY861_09965 [bacterium]|nr:hypothetical protein [bacterium]